MAGLRPDPPHSPMPPGIRSWSDGRIAPEAMRPIELIAIGCSMGGMHALQVILSVLPREMPPILIVQHRYRNSGDALPDFLARSAEIDVVDADDKQWVKPGSAYLAPANYHLLIDPTGELSLSTEAAVTWSRPSVDVLFESAAEAYGSTLLAVVLTGANDDGARGVVQVKKRGGLVVVQDPATAEAPAMPKAAVAATTVDRILPLDRIGPFLVEVCRNRN